MNAGHQPPILFFRECTPGKACEIELSNGGTVIGPLPEARFRRGFARLHPGEVLLLLTDGILERRDKNGEFFGDDRVRAVVREQQAQPAETILAKLFDAALAWGEGGPGRTTRRSSSSSGRPRTDPGAEPPLRASPPAAPRRGPRCSRPW